MPVLIDEQGKKYGRWTVLHRSAEASKCRTVLWVCKCTCGNKRVIDGATLRKGTSTSCGCKRTDTKENSYHWKGGKIKNNGYIYLYKPEHPNAKMGHGYVSEHVYVMSQILGRPLDDKETVHHKDGIKNHNNPDNLELWTSSHPTGQRVSDLVEWANNILRKYGKT